MITKEYAKQAAKLIKHYCKSMETCEKCAFHSRYCVLGCYCKLRLNVPEDWKVK